MIKSTMEKKMMTRPLNVKQSFCIIQNMQIVELRYVERARRIFMQLYKIL